MKSVTESVHFVLELTQDLSKPKHYMDVSLVETIADQLVGLNFKGIVNISGTGEPLLTKHITDIVKQFGDRGIHIEIVTNGDMLVRKKVSN